MSFNRYFLWTIPVICQVVTEFDSEINESPNYDIDINTKDGLHLQFLVFDKHVQEELEPNLGTELNEAFTNIMQCVDKLVFDMLLDKISIIGWLAAGKDLFNIARRVPKEGLKFGSKIGYNKYIIRIFGSMLAKSKGIEKDLEEAGAEKDPQKLADEVHKQLQGLIEMYQVSPSSIFIAYEKGAINGKPSEPVLAELMGKLRYHGHSGVLNIGEKVLNFIFNLN